MNYQIVKALAALRPIENPLLTPLPEAPSKSLPIPVAVATPVVAEEPPPEQPHSPSSEAHAYQHQSDNTSNAPRHFQRGLGTYPLRSAAFLATRRHVPHNPAAAG
eukprot:5496750-Pleurochrysis_carterae.AAC.1